MHRKDIMSSLAYVSYTPLKEIKGYAKKNKHSNIEDAYEDLLLDVLVNCFDWKPIDKKDINHNSSYHKNDAELKFFYGPNDYMVLKDNKWSNMNSVKFTPDIVTKDCNNNYYLIEVKRIYKNSAKNYPEKKYFRSHDYDYLYCESQRLNYGLENSAIHTWSTDRGEHYLWYGGPFLLSQNNTFSLGWWQEGQIWWDLNRLLYIKNNLDSKYHLYLVGFVENPETPNISREFFTSNFSNKLTNVIEHFKKSSVEYIYKDYNKKLQRNFKQKMNKYRLSILFPDQADIWATFLIEIQ